MKRPIVLAAILLVAVIFVLYHINPNIFIPEVTFEDREEILLSGQIVQIEHKSGSCYLYLNHSCASDGQSDPLQDGISLGVTLLTAEEELEEQMNLRIGNRILARCEYREFQTARNEGNFDERMYYYSEGVFLRARVRNIAILDPSVFSVKQWIYELRNRMNASIYAAVKEEETAGILTAICTGDRSALTDQTKILYQRSGIAHILAVSGLHISLVGMGVFRLLRRSLRFSAAGILSCLIMIGFCALSGASPSSVRATIMFLLQITAIGLGKRYDILCAASVAGILMLLQQPLFLFHTGFQLSFAAILAVGILFRPLEAVFLRNRRTHKEQSEKSRRLWLYRLGSSFLLSLSVTLFTLPLVASAYYEVPLYSVLLNLLIVPLMSTVLGSGLFTALLGMIHLLSGRFASGIGVYLVELIRFLCYVNTKLPGNSVVTGAVTGWRIVLYYLFMGIGILFLHWYLRHLQTASDERYRLASCCWLFILYGVMLLAILFVRKPDEKLRISFLDVGQGECILLCSPSGTTVMIDGGSTSVSHPGQYRIQSTVKYQGIETIDYVYVTHPDTDHINGILEILEGMRPDHFAWNTFGRNSEQKTVSALNLKIRNLLIPDISGNEHYEQLIRLAEDVGVNLIILHSGMVLQDDWFTLTCLHPDRSFHSDDVNDYSAVLDLRFGEFSALFTGDLGEEGEQLLLQSGPGEGNADLASGYDLLKVAHHGSRYSSSGGFLERVSPQWAVISAGIRNQYGHPHEEALERLAQVGAEVFVTADYGEIRITADLNGNVIIWTFL